MPRPVAVLWMCPMAESGRRPLSYILMKLTTLVGGPLLAVSVSLAAAQSAAAPADGEALSNLGVRRAGAVVDSVYVDRLSPVGRIAGGDWVSYLMARLGARSIRDDLTVRVLVDSTRIRILAQFRDLPRETRADLGPLLAMMDSTSTIAADVVLLPAVTGVVKFQLRSASLNDIPVPDVILQSVMAEVGRRYPVLTGNGRELLVQIPPDGRMALVPGGIRLETGVAGR
ncbi:MAG: hypothetical protein ACOY71_03435 [Gemmatimonadota bacterium]